MELHSNKKGISYRRAIRLGYITEHGDFIRCYFCGSTELENTDNYMEDIGGHYEAVEYTVVCKCCKNEQGHWSYGGADPVYVLEPKSKWEDLL